MAVTLYRQVGKGKNRRYTKINLGPGRRPAGLAGPYFPRYSLPDGTRPWEPVGYDLEAAIEAQKRKQEYFRALRANVPVQQDQQDPARLKITDTVYRWLETAVKPSVRQKTCQDYEGMLRRYVRPSLGERLLTALRPLDLQTTYQQMMERGLSARTVRYTHAVC